LKKYLPFLGRPLQLHLGSFLMFFLVKSQRKFIVWVFTYAVALFNGLTLLQLALISLFTIPLLNENHQVEIDHSYAVLYQAQSLERFIQGLINKKKEGILTAKKAASYYCLTHVLQPLRAPVPL
uniref:Reticulon n=1 Tax=Podarcis muralis TaxID=64176 RepID=A0A670K7D9_PODMU